MIKFACPHCSASLSGSEERLGRPGRCPKCHVMMTIDRNQVAQLPALIDAPPNTQARPVTDQNERTQTVTLLWVSQAGVAALCVFGWFLPTGSRAEPTPGIVDAANYRVGTQGAFDVVTAQKLHIDAGRGRVLALGALDTGEVGLTIIDSRTGRSYMIALTDDGLVEHWKDGPDVSHVRGAKLLNDEGIAEYFYDPAGKGRIKFAVGGMSSVVSVLDSTEQQRVSLTSANKDNISGVLVIDRHGRPKEALVTQ